MAENKSVVLDLASRWAQSLKVGEVAAKCVESVY